MTHYYIKQFGAKGTFINIVSFAGFIVFPGLSSYAISKLAATKFGEFLDAGIDTQASEDEPLLKISFQNILSFECFP